MGIKCNGIVQMDQQESSKRKLKRIDWSIVNRILRYLHYDGKEKKTNIAMKCNLSYNKLVMYLDWLEMMEFITRELDEKKFECISLNEKGREFYTRKLKDVEYTETDQQF